MEDNNSMWHNLMDLDLSEEVKEPADVKHERDAAVLQATKERERAAREEWRASCEEERANVLEAELAVMNEIIRLLESQSARPEPSFLSDVLFLMAEV